MTASVSNSASLWSLAAKELRYWARPSEREVTDYPFADSDVAQLHRLAADPEKASIDDATWRDLLLGTYCSQLSREVSIFGQHVLYRRLRQGGDGVERIKEFVAQPALLEQTRATCQSLRHADKEIATLLYATGAPVVPRWVGKVWPLTLLLVGAAVASIWYPAALAVVAAVLYFLVSNQMRYYSIVEDWARSNKSLQMLLRVVSLQGGEDAALAGRINRGITRSPVAAMMPPLPAYQDWFLLENVSHYFRCRVLVERNQAFLQRCVENIGNLEADLAIARHLAGTPLWCWSAVGPSDAIALDAAVHPLLAEAQPLPVAMAGRGIFISGQNGIGKSTLLRTIGINLASARAFGFCYARSAVVPALPVYASMQSEDSMLGGESLYMAELRRARELLDAADGAHPGVYIIDEIFRGTNHLESVSAAASVLDVLAAKGLVVVSSHNLVLASLLAHRLAPMCVAKGQDGRLSLSPGVLAHTNGIALLSQRGFGHAVEVNAGKVFDWLDGYLAHPPNAHAVLGQASASLAGAQGVPPRGEAVHQ